MKEKYKFFSNILQTFFIETILWFSGVVWETEYEAIIPKAISKTQKMLLTLLILFQLLISQLKLKTYQIVTLMKLKDHGIFL